jgi:hypothetical protein
MPAQPACIGRDRYHSAQPTRAVLQVPEAEPQTQGLLRQTTSWCIEARHAHRFLSSRTNNTDRNDARGHRRASRRGRSPSGCSASLLRATSTPCDGLDLLAVRRQRRPLTEHLDFPDDLEVLTALNIKRERRIRPTYLPQGGEVIETMLSLCTLLPELRCAAALSANHRAALLLPADLRRLYIAMDNDRDGRASVSGFSPAPTGPMATCYSRPVRTGMPTSSPMRSPHRPMLAQLRRSGATRPPAFLALRRLFHRTLAASG